MTMDSEDKDPSYYNNPLARTITHNVESNIIKITEDKLENILIKHSGKLVANSDWKNRLGIFITISLALLTASFDKDFILNSEEWAAIFKIGFFLSGVWLLFSIYRAFSDRAESSITSLIEKIKAN